MPLTELDFVFNLVAVVGAIAFGALAVQQKTLMRAVFSFAAASAFLAMLFFLLASPFAAVLELTVGAGLIVVLFLVALTLSTEDEDEVIEGGQA
jgi:uncharacterized MnhB-related membrane protein